MGPQGPRIEKRLLRRNHGILPGSPEKGGRRFRPGQFCRAQAPPFIGGRVLAPGGVFQHQRFKIQPVALRRLAQGRSKAFRQTVGLPGDLPEFFCGLRNHPRRKTIYAIAQHRRVRPDGLRLCAQQTGGFFIAGAQQRSEIGSGGKAANGDKIIFPTGLSHGLRQLQERPRHTGLFFNAVFAHGSIPAPSGKEARDRLSLKGGERRISAPGADDDFFSGIGILPDCFSHRLNRNLSMHRDGTLLLTFSPF